MLQEITALQDDTGRRRRWFQDERMDLFIWQDDTGAIKSFQLAYDKPHAEKALTWKEESGSSHLSVDDGKRPGRHPGSPVLVADGVCDVDRLQKDFRERAGKLQYGIIDFIVTKLREHAESSPPS